MDELTAAQAPPVGTETLTQARTITESDVISFAALTGDWHPQHADAEWAARGHFGERVAHGMLVLSYAVGLIAFDPERVVALRGLDGVTFKRPALIGDTIRVESRVDRVKPLDSEHALVAFAWRIINQHDKVVIRARIEALWKLDDLDQGTKASSNGSVEPDDLYVGLVLL